MNFDILTLENLKFMGIGALWSIILAVSALVCGTILGIIGAAGRISKHRIPRFIASAYVEIIRGTPMLLQIFFFFLAVPSIIRMITGVPFTPQALVVGWAAMSINSGAYSTELIRSGIVGVDKGQWEAGKALGLSYFQVMRFIILPQAFKRIVPPLVSEFITLIKDSSLVSTIGAVELLGASKILGARYYEYLTPLLTASIFYLCITMTISFFARRLERRLAVSD